MTQETILLFFTGLSILFAVLALWYSRNANRIANEAKNIAYKSMMTEERKYADETTQKEKAKRMNILPYFKVSNHQDPRNENLRYVNIQNQGNGPARNVTIEIASDYNHKLTSDKQKLFEVGTKIMQLAVNGERKKPYSLIFCFEDNEGNNYRQDISHDGQSWDDNLDPSSYDQYHLKLSWVAILLPHG